MGDQHFKGKGALEHVLEKRTSGSLAVSEAHGTEMPGHLSAGADALRETALLLLLMWLSLRQLHAPARIMTLTLLGLALGLLIWKTGRSAWLGWARLERLHRLMLEERQEIEHHRPQEREELKALYASKGLEGKLLEDVLDVLMADNDRLLKVMLEEEMGLTLAAYEHPLKQAVGACVGVLFALLVMGFLYLLFPLYGIVIAAIGLMCAGASVSARYEKNKLVRALVWNLAIACLAGGGVYYLLGAIA